MPGLLRGVARTAAIAGTATAVSGRVARRQAGRYAEKDAHLYAQREQAYEREMAPTYTPAPAPPPPAAPVAPAAPSGGDLIDLLQKLGDLKQQGILTEAEFAAEKAKLLGA